jgi:hypothetical protein
MAPLAEHLKVLHLVRSVIAQLNDVVAMGLLSDAAQAGFKDPAVPPKKSSAQSILAFAEELANVRVSGFLTDMDPMVGPRERLRAKLTKFPDRLHSVPQSSCPAKSRSVF